MKRKSLLLSLAIFLCTGCNLFSSGELTKQQVINYWNNIDRTNNYNFSNEIDVLTAYNVTASDEYLNEIGKTVDEFYQEQHSQLQMGYSRITGPEIGVEYLVEGMPQARFFSDYSYVEQIESYFYPDSVMKFYLENNMLLLEWTEIRDYYKGINSIDTLNLYYDEVENVWELSGEENLYKVDHKDGESIIIEGSSKGWNGDIEYLIGFDSETQKIDLFEITQNYETFSYFGEEQIEFLRNQLIGLDKVDDIDDIDYRNGATISTKGLLDSLKENLIKYQEFLNQDNKWKYIERIKEIIIIKYYIDKEGYIAEGTQYAKTEVYRKDIWCYTIEIEISFQEVEYYWKDIDYTN